MWAALSCRACPEELSSEGTRACKSKAQSGTLFLRVVTSIVPFCLDVKAIKRDVNEDGRYLLVGLCNTILQDLVFLTKFFRLP